MSQLAAVAIENALLHERLAFQAQHDTLTELPNRLLFQDRVQQALRLARRHQKRIALLWIDLDRFKHINDTLGHRAGDEVLCEVGRRLTSCLRESDTVARVGGDEFTVLAHDISSSADADLVCRKILAALSQPMVLGERSIAITASAGVSIFPEHGKDPIVLMRHADLAMYSAKRAGGNTQQVFRPVMGDAMLLRLQIEGELKTALERDEFSLAYQPLLNRQGGLGGLEALLRWNNATLGRVSPADFIPIAEEMGLIQTIGEWVMRMACRTGALWLDAGLTVPSISVNVSAVQFVDKGFAAAVERALKDAQLPATKLTLEITETALVNNLDEVLEQMAALRRLGVRFAIDDFGTGYSSLSQLGKLPVDSVKVDRSFVKDLDTAGNASTILVRGIIALAHSLGLEVVAEGVETEEQLALLNGMGCDIAQGFLLHRPMPAEQVEKLLADSTAVGLEDEQVTTTEFVRV
jgi:diguanylate cyclase (GGDEF)-like protein